MAGDEIANPYRPARADASSQERNVRLMKPIFLLVAYALSMPLWGCATQHPRVAMVVGNAEYKHASPLAHPTHDARELGRHLEALGWNVSTAIDLPDEGLTSALDAFEDQVGGAEQAIFFYSGHGMQINGENYIVPVAFNPRQAERDRDLISMSEFIERLQEFDTPIAIFLDASRDNPMTSNFKGVVSRNRRRLQREGAESDGLAPVFGIGLAEFPAGQDTFIAYSTAPGHVAHDGLGEHSPFSRALLKFIDRDTQDVTALLLRVRHDVVDSTGGSQVPWDHSSLFAPFWISGKPVNPPTNQDPPTF